MAEKIAARKPQRWKHIEMNARTMLPTPIHVGSAAAYPSQQTQSSISAKYTSSGNNPETDGAQTPKK